jgi:hypothetical protein
VANTRNISLDSRFDAAIDNSSKAAISCKKTDENLWQQGPYFFVRAETIATSEYGV